MIEIKKYNDKFEKINNDISENYDKFEK